MHRRRATVVVLLGVTACTSGAELLWVGRRGDAGGPALPAVADFNAAVGARGFDGGVHGLAVDPATQNLYVVGAFTAYGGTEAHGIVRLLPSGEADPSFVTGRGFDRQALVVTLDSDGRPIVGGSFTSYDGHARGRLARLNRDGSVDQAFQPAALDDVPTALVWDGARGHLYVAGWFSTVGGRSQSGLARLLADGSRDPTYATGSGYDNPAYGLALDSAAGTLYTAGWPGVYAGAAVGVLRRHHLDGRLDTTWGTVLEDRNFARQVVRASTGELFVVGDYLGASGETVLFVRLDGAGRFAPGYVPYAVDLDTLAYVLQLDASGTTLWVGGDFTTYGTTPAAGLIALNLDGTVSPKFAQVPAYAGSVLALAEGDGRLYVGGEFSAVDGGPPARLHAVVVPP